MLATGKHTQIVLTRGVGLHTYLGISIDIAVGDVIDKASNYMKKYDAVLKDHAQRKEFMDEYNLKNPGN